MRIVSLLPSTTEIVCALGLADDLVGITHECDHPATITHKPRLTASRISHETMTSAEIDHAVRSQLDGHGSIYDLDEASLRDLGPDLILTQELCEVCAVSYQKVTRAARSFEADVKVVSLEPNAIEDIFANIRMVGELTGRANEADKLLAGLTTRLDRVREKTSVVVNRPRTLMLEWLEPPFAPGHWVPEQVAIAGGRPVIGWAGEPSRKVPWSAVAGADPEVMVLGLCGFDLPTSLREWASFWPPEPLTATAAWQAGELWAIDGSAYVSRPGPRLIDGVEIVAAVLAGRPDARAAKLTRGSRARVGA